VGSIQDPSAPGVGLRLPPLMSPMMFGRTTRSSWDPDPADGMLAPVPPVPPVKSKLSVVEMLRRSHSPLTNAFSPETCQPSKSVRITALSHSLLALGMSHV
jgi:hypothetical protein